MKPALVLFDLDGTLADTAPDLAAVANRMRAVRGLAPLPYDELRPLASHGARGLIGKALGVAQQESGFVTLRDEFFATYEAALCVHSRLFEGMEAVLGAIEARGARWGIVTNKMMRFTDPLVAALGLRERAACVVSGDTTPHAKPHPAPLLHALTACEVAAGATVYVGDDLRDIEAGRAAGLATVAVRYGYLGEGRPIEDWGADRIVATPDDLLPLVR
ncbi:MAG: phosphoglycolate phosphatase [Burkholderiales bacterium]|nr:phosphoglycolate phosphatase [Burkholderiales bacterium]